jgi:CubicO group peptidase (beta-lactamase class C family)
MRKAFLTAGLLLCVSMPPLAAQPADDPAVEARIQRIVGNIAPATVIRGAAAPGITLDARMKALNVPGVSVAVIRDGKIQWARGFGVTRMGGPSVTTSTLFQAGSISKPVAALALLHLAQTGRIDLDTDVNQYLKSWKVPENEFTKDKKVTVRGLLTHTAGLTVHGFPGYARGAAVPTTVQVLDGEKPANTAAIRVDTVPGTNWRYSGGGYTIAQLLVADVTGKPFEIYLQETVLGPIGMTHSTYEQPLPAARQTDVATPYLQSGAPVPGGAHTYPEMAAAGLWTNASDLARYAIEVQQALAGRSSRVINKAIATEMVKPGGMGNYGMGPGVGGKPERPYFQHGGVDEGFIAGLIAYNSGDGLAIMTNSMGGGQLIQELQRTIAREYGWPDFAPPEKAVVKVDAKLVDAYAGHYRGGRFIVWTLSRQDDHLAARQNERDVGELYPASETEWFSGNLPVTFTFQTGAGGAVTGFTQRIGNNNNPAARISAAEAQAIADELIAKVKNKVQDKATDAALRRNIEELRMGKPSYDRMSPGLANVTRQQLTQLQALMTDFGAVQTVTFKDVTPNGLDVYEVAFEKGSAEFRIGVDTDGTIETIGLRKLS